MQPLSPKVGHASSRDWLYPALILINTLNGPGFVVLAEAGRQAGALVGTATELRDMITPKFLHETPLGPATRDVTQPCLDPFPVEWTYQPPRASAATSARRRRHGLLRLNI